MAQTSYEKTKEIAGDLKATAKEKIECLKSSKEELKEKPNDVELKEENKNDK